MNMRFVISDHEIVVILLIVLLAFGNHMHGVIPSELVNAGVAVLGFMFLMNLLETTAQALAKSPYLRVCAALLQITNAYRSIGARLPIGFTARIYLAALNQLSNVRTRQLRFVDAIACMKKHNELAEARFGKSSPEAAEGLINMSYIYSLKEEPELAEKFGELGLQALDQANLTRRQMENLSITLNNLGTAYTNMGKTARGLELLNRCVKLKKDLFGPMNPSYGTSLANIGYSLVRAKKFEEGSDFLRDALAIPQPDETKTATFKNNFGEALRGMGKLDESEKVLTQALKVRQERLPPNHPHMAYSYHNLGKLYADKHDYKQSEIFFKKAIDLRMKSLPPGSDLLKETKDDYRAFCTVTD